MKLFIAALISISVASASWARPQDATDIVVQPPAGDLGQNLTAELYQLLQLENIEGKWPPLGPSLKAKLKSHYVIFVPEVLSGYAEKFMELYAYEMDFLKQNGFKRGKHFKKLGPADGFNGEAGPDYNAFAISRAIQAAPRPVILVSHSKGTVDLLHFWITYPWLRDKVRGWISMQAPVWGSPVADVVTNSPEMKTYEWILRATGGNREAIDSLRQNVRQDFMLRNLREISTLANSFPIISLGSIAPREKLDPLLKVADFMYGSQMREQALNRNDGLVPLDNSMIPSSDYVVMTEFDHFQTSKKHPFPAMLMLLLRN